jgi:hypothetical protein
MIETRINLKVIEYFLFQKKNYKNLFAVISVLNDIFKMFALSGRKIIVDKKN